jgi:hypothetical protein
MAIARRTVRYNPRSLPLASHSPKFQLHPVRVSPRQNDQPFVVALRCRVPDPAHSTQSSLPFRPAEWV